MSQVHALTLTGPEAWGLVRGVKNEVGPLRQAAEDPVSFDRGIQVAIGAVAARITLQMRKQIMTNAICVAGHGFVVDVRPRPAGGLILTVSDPAEPDFELSLLCKKPGTLTVGIIQAAGLCVRHAIATMRDLKDEEVSPETVEKWPFLRDAVAEDISNCAVAEV